jgi:hypothetical protein
MDDITEKDVVEALRQATEIVEEVEQLTANMPREHAQRLRRSSRSMAVNLAMALQTFRNRPSQS